MSNITYDCSSTYHPPTASWEHALSLHNADVCLLPQQGFGFKPKFDLQVNFEVCSDQPRPGTDQAPALAATEK
eukprot:scaffold192487_cov14-Tisochrysis_lutea.AAC.1